MSGQFELPGTEDWTDVETVTPLSGRPLTLRYYLVRDEDSLTRMRDVLVAARDIAWDTETSGLCAPLGARICGYAFATQTAPAEISCWYVPIRHHLAVGQLPVERVSAVAQEILTAPGRCGYAHAKFEWQQARADGVTTTREPHDVQSLAQCANENEPTFALKALAAKYCLPEARTEEKALEQWMKADARALGLPYKNGRVTDELGIDVGQQSSYLERFGFSRTPVALCGRYACRDVFYTLYLWRVTFNGVARQYAEVYTREMAIARELHEMEWAGLPVDEDAIRTAHDVTADRIRHWRTRLNEIVGYPFEPTDANLRTLFYGREGFAFTPPKFTKTKAPSTDDEARKLLAAKHPACRPLMEALSELADATKLHSTYTTNFLRYVSSDTARIYPSYNMMQGDRAAPVTGRLSSANPNIQNIPRDAMHLGGCQCSECGDGSKPMIIDVRGYFTVPDGMRRMFVDFNQIELRVLAWLCQDPNLLHAYINGIDVHAMTMEKLGIERPVAKQVNFLTVYGGTKMALAQRMHGYYEDPEGTRARADQIIVAFFQQYAAIKRFEADLVARMRRSGKWMFVSPFGRPRRIPDLGAPEEWIRAKARRRMMSSIVSGSAADLMKSAMLRTAPIARKAGGALMMSIHDELVFDLPAESFDGPACEILAAMTDWPIFRTGPERFGKGIPIEAKAEVTDTSWRDKRGFAKSIDGRVTRIG